MTQPAHCEHQPTIATAGDGYPLKVVKRDLSADVRAGKNCLVKILGEWYDIGEYMEIHPGGDIIKELIGKDCTVLLRMWHPTYVFQNPQLFVKRVAESDIHFLDEPTHHQRHRYVLPTRPKPLGEADLEYLQLYADAEKSGYFRGTTQYLRERFAIIAVFMFAAIYFLRGWSPLGHSIYAHIVGAFCLFWFWHQNTGIMHDAGHNQYLHGNIRKNSILSFVCGNIGAGLSSNFWKWEHVEHHTFTISFDEKLGNTDPQQTEDVWFPDWQLVDHAPQNYLTWCLLRIQAYIAPVAIVLVAKIGITVDAFVTETRWWEFVGLAVHLCWTALLLSDIYNNFGMAYALGVYYIAAMFFGILAFQLQSNHMDREWIRKHEEHEKSAESRPKSHIHRHIASCTNIAIPRWLDWSWCGLNFHIEHHCFPRMAREHCRVFSAKLRDFCDRHGYEYSTQGCWETACSVFNKMNEVRNIRDVFDLGREGDAKRINADADCDLQGLSKSIGSIGTMERTRSR